MAERVVIESKSPSDASIYLCFAKKSPQGIFCIVETFGTELEKIKTDKVVTKKLEMVPNWDKYTGKYWKPSEAKNIQERIEPFDESKTYICIHAYEFFD
jgi:hypothetical protein